MFGKTKLSFEWNELDENCFPLFKWEPLGGTVVELSIFGRYLDMVM